MVIIELLTCTNAEKILSNSNSNYYMIYYQLILIVCKIMYEILYIPA